MRNKAQHEQTAFTAVLRAVDLPPVLLCQKVIDFQSLFKC
jgi:methyl coenzyme M reductase subunit C